MLLLLFDIDGTLLLKASREHAAAMLEALHVVHGVAEPAHPHLEAAGRTDNEIARAILVASGVSADRIDAHVDDVREETCRAFVRLAPPSFADRISPGMDALLERLDSRPDVRLGLLTGNFEEIARMKLERAGLVQHFPAHLGGFGSDHEDRTELPAIARARAGTGDRPWPRGDTLIIGDTPRDIACARFDRVRVAAIATGPYDAGQLAGADAVLRSVTELSAYLDELLAGTEPVSA